MPFAIDLLEFLKQDVYLIFPQIILISTATLMLWPGNILLPKRHQGNWAFVSIFALLLAGLFVSKTPMASGFAGMFKVDGATKGFQYIILLSGVIVFLLSNLQLDVLKKHSTEYYSLLLFSLAGMLFLVGATDLVSIYFAMELMSLCIYILVAYFRTKERSIEAGVKYFLLGAFSSGILLFGISILFAVSGGVTTNLFEINERLALIPLSNNLLMFAGTIMVLVGFFFKIAAAPFHMWSPDVYDGAPTSVTAFISVAPKVASISAFMHVLGIGLNSTNHNWKSIVAIIAVISMIWGNIAALKQQTIKRLLAYSGIAHIGYMLMGVMHSGTPNGMQAVWLYMFTYLIMQSGIFAIVIFLQNKDDGERIDDFRGLAKTYPLLAFAMMILLLSLAGIPPFLGFFSKFYLFKLVIEQCHSGMVIIAVLTSAIAAYYYLGIVALMYFKEPIAKSTIKRSVGTVTTIIVSSSCIFTLLGICFGSYLIKLVTMII
jgi:NADH-quinone oxidoreductase subunit N